MKYIYLIFKYLKENSIYLFNINIINYILKWKIKKKSMTNLKEVLKMKKDQVKVSIEVLNKLIY